MSELHQSILNALSERTEWENKQRIYYALRHEGMRRARPPYPNAPDVHYPLVDGAIEGFKPFYVNQLTADEYLAEFTALRQDLAPFRDAARQFFDWKVKNRTDFFEGCMSATDTMLMRGRGILKHYWDPQEKRQVIEEVDPLFFVVPTRSEGPDKDDWFVHIKSLSVAAYQRSPVYDQDPALIERIRGGSREEAAQTTTDTEKFQREGLTDTKDRNDIIIWEVWQKTAEKWLVREYSPLDPATDLRRPRFAGEKWRGKYWQPFVGYASEIKGKGWYSPRGLGERLGPFEIALCKQWNAKLEALDFIGKPLFTREDDLPGNTLNITFQPGEVLPKGVKVQPMQPLPTSFEQDMSQTRAVAQDYIKMPDAGVSADPTQPQTGEKPTARQVSYQASLTNSTTNMRGFVYRLCLRESLWRMWALEVQHQPEELAYFVGQDIKTLPQEALSDQFDIAPAGAIEAWNRNQRKNDAAQRFNALRDDPMIDQEELRRDLLNAQDARLSGRLLVPPGRKQAAEAEDEAIEIGALLMHGWPAVALPTEDHALRLRILYGKLEQLGQLGVPVDPTAAQRFQEHIQQHLQLLAQQNPTLAKQFTQAMAVASGAEDGEFGTGSSELGGNVVPMAEPGMAGDLEAQPMMAGGAL